MIETRGRVTDSIKVKVPNRGHERIWNQFSKALLEGIQREAEKR